MTLNSMFKSRNTEPKPFFLNTNDSKATMKSSRAGLGNFQTNNANNICGNDLFYGNIRMESITPMAEQALCQPRRVSFTQHGEDENDYERQLLTLLDTENRTSKKAVRFSTQVTVVDTTVKNKERSTPQPWNGTLTEEHCKELWYQKEELVAIKHAAKVLIARRNKTQSNSEFTPEEHQELVGLERFNKQRAVWKKLSIRSILMAQREMSQLHVRSIYNGFGISKDEYIQKVSLRRSEWASEAAKMQGFRDYCAVHDPLAPLFGDSDSNNGNAYWDDAKEGTQNYNELIFGETTPLTTGSKRQIGAIYDAYNEPTGIDDDSLGRRVRCRTSQQPKFI